MSLLRVYIAVSVDGYIADERGEVGWLDPFFTDEIDFKAFAATIGATIMGRRTFEQALGFDGWRPPSNDTIVMTHRPLDDAPPGVRAFSGDVRELADELRHETAAVGKDVWLMGGGESIRAFHEADLVDRWELFFIPVLLGAGVRLFPGGAPAEVELMPTRTKSYGNGILEVWYEPREDEAG